MRSRGRWRAPGSPTRYNYRVSYVLAVTAAFVNALTSVLQRLGVESAPSSAALRLSLMAHAVRRKIWLVGFALMLVVFALQATALRLGQLSVVQPVITTELLFLLIILAVWFHYHLGWREWDRVDCHRGPAAVVCYSKERVYSRMLLITIYLTFSKLRCQIVIPD